jgi:acyl-CoA synthetase (NDP forming)
VVSISGGACDMLADHAADLGAPLPILAPPTRAALAGILPEFGTVQNPLDITGAAVIEPGIFTRCIEVVSADPSVGVVAVISPLPWHGHVWPWPGQVLADAIGAGAALAKTPVVCVSQAMQPVSAYTREVMTRAGIPYTIPGLRECVAALHNVGWWSQATARPRTRSGV